MIPDNPYLGEVIPPALAIKAMQDSGYKNTAFALAELIDNAIQAGGDLVEVFCLEERQLVNERYRQRIREIAVLDNGIGMDSETLRMALQFGNGTRLNDRSGMGRFGMGLPNASISQCRRVDVWTWQAGLENAIHTCLDLDSIESGQTRFVPEPQPSPVPNEWRELSNNFEVNGTLIVWSKLQPIRLTWKTGKITLKHTEAICGRMYRKFIHEGNAEIRLVAIRDGEVEFDQFARANDPLYLMSPSSTPEPFQNKSMFQKWGEQDAEFEIDLENHGSHTVAVRISWALPETLPTDGTDRGHTQYGKHAGNNIGVSIVRAGRELDLDSSWVNGYDPRERWWGVEVEFPPALDEIFGVTNNKQAATVFSHMAQFSWEAEAEPGESYMSFKMRLLDEGDTRVLLLDIVNYIRDQLKEVRKRLQDQSKGRRSGGRRHDEVTVEDTASTKWKQRAVDGHRIATDDEEYDDTAQKVLTEDLINKNYPEDIAQEIAIAVRQRDRKIIFVTADSDSQAFFNVESRPGGITEVVFNSRHPAYEKFIKMLDKDVSDDNDSDLVSRIENASDMLKLLLAAWARYEEEDVPSREQIRDIRHEWGKMAKNFLLET